MTDAETKSLFTYGAEAHRIAYAPVSRLLVDEERFEDDAQEPMAARGMGVVYTRTAFGSPLRRTITSDEREALIESYYRPHHAMLAAMTKDCIEAHDKCLIIDCHSFPSQPLPYEPVQDLSRPDICIGTDSYHTPEELEASFSSTFSEDGFRAAINTPFAGALVSLDRYGSDKRVASIMVEINRSLYYDEIRNERRDNFDEIAARVSRICLIVVERWANQ